MMQNETKMAFDNLQKEFDDATPEGGAPVRPPDGVHRCLITGCVAGMGTFRQRGGGEFPAATLYFEYELESDPDRDQPLQFRGQTFTLPIQIEQITNEKSRLRVNIELGRLKNHIMKILGREPGNLAADIQAIQDLLNGDTVILAMVRTKTNVRNYVSDEGEPRTFTIWNEYINEVVSGAAATA